jgi:tellurite methyltransferase
MIARNDGGYEAGYSACDCFWGLVPGTYVQRLAGLLDNFSELRILDAGCGEGKNAAWLAGKGATVTAVEISRRALDHARRLHPHASVDWLCADVTKQTWPPAFFDVVIAYGLFHCLSSTSDITMFHATLSNATKVGGYHVICSFNDRDQDLSAHPDFEPCLASHEFYCDLYRAWNIEAVSDETRYETHPHNMLPHHHSLSRLIARKCP